MPGDWKEAFEAKRNALIDTVIRTSTEDLKNSLRYAALTMSRWQFDVIRRELQARERNGDPGPQRTTTDLSTVSLPNPDAWRRPVVKPPEPPPQPTAWDRVLKGDLV